MRAGRCAWFGFLDLWGWIMLTVEVWIVVDADGDVAATGVSEEQAYTNYREEFGKDGPTRCVKVALTLPEPKAVEVLATLTEEAASVAVEVQAV